MSHHRFLLAFLLLAACSAGGEGKLTLEARLPDDARPRAAAAPFQRAAYDAASDVQTIYVAALNGNVVVAEASFSVAEREGELIALPSGEYEVVVEGRVGETAVYRGRKPGIRVEPATVTDAGEFLLAPVAPRPPVMTTFPAAITNAATGVISGAKEMFTGIQLNGTTLVAPDDEKTFRFEYRLTEGVNELAVAVVNPEGAASKPAKITSELDTVAPVAKSFAIAAVQGGVTFTVAADGAAEMAISADPALAQAAWMPYAAGGTFATTAATLYVQVRDRAGNRSQILSASLPLNLPPGNPTVAVFGSPSAVSTSSVTLQLSATGGPAEMQVSESAAFTGATWAAFAASHPFTLSATDGTKTVYAKFRNAGGESPVTSTSVTLDTVAPTVTLFAVAGSPAAVSSPTVSLDVVASEGAQIQLSEGASFSGAAWISFDPAPVFTLTAFDGLKVIYLRVRDVAGNTSSSALTSVDLDTSPPWTEIVVPAIGAYYNTVPVASGSAVDNATVSSVSVALQRHSDAMYWNGAAFSSSLPNWQAPSGTTAWTWTMPALPNGGYTLFTRAGDAAGNVESPATNVSFTLDTLPPTTPGIPVPAANPVSGPVSLAWTASTDDTAFAHYEVERSADAVTFASLGTTATASFGDTAADGTYYYRVSAVDRAGNVSQSATSVAVTIDTTPPVVSSLDVSSGSAGDAVWITGEGFGSVQAGSTVTVGAVSATVLSWSSSMIQIQLPANSGAGPQTLKVTVIGMPSLGAGFTVVPQFTGAAAPAVGTAGTPVSFAGTNLAPLEAIRIGGVPMLSASGSMFAAAADVPNNVTAGTQTITLQAGGVVTSTPVTFSVTPQLTTASTSAFVGGAGYSLSGTNLGATQGASVLSAGGYPLTATSWSHTSIFFDIPGSVPAGTYPLSVTVGGITATLASLSIAPRIALVTPGTMSGGDVVTVNGAGFGPSQGASTLTIGGAPMTPGSWTDTSLALTLPTAVAGGNVDFVVTVNGLASNAYGAIVTPKITSASNLTPPAGTAITLSGMNFGAVQGAGTVTVGALSATVTSWSTTSITLTVPLTAAAGAQDVVVTVGGRSSAPLAVTVTQTAKLAFTSLPNMNTPAGSCVGAVFEFQDALSQAAPLKTSTLVSYTRMSGVFVQFFDTPGCFTPVPSTLYSAGATQGVVYYRGVTAGTTTIDISAVGLTSAQQTEGIVAGPPVALQFTAAATAAVNQCISVTVTSTDAYGNPSNVGATTSVLLSDSGAGQFNSGALCPGPTTITSTLLNTGTNTAAVYFSDLANELTTLSATATGLSPATHALIVGTPLPTITSLTPASALPNTPVTLNGLSFGDVRGAKDNVYFGGVSAAVSLWAANVIQVVAPPDAMPGAVSVAVRAGGLWSNRVMFEHKRPWIDGRSPSEGTAGTLVTLTGRYFEAAQGTVSIGGSNSTVQAWYPTTITVTAPAGLVPGIVDVQATTVSSWLSNRVYLTQRGNDVWLPFDGEVPQARARHTAVWTGAEMLIWSGRTGRSQVTGSRYNPGTDAWLPTADAPIEGRYGHSAVWTGKEMIVWGGLAYSGAQTNTGARYNPAADAWTIMTTTGAPTAVERHAAVWIDDEMVVTGGFAGGTTYSAQSLAYNPETDAWRPLGANPALPTARADHRMVWTGIHLYVLGGFDGAAYLADVQRWDPATQAWVPTTSFTTGRSKFIAAFGAPDTIIIHSGEAAGPSYRSDLQSATIAPNGTLGTWTLGATAVNARSEAVGVWTGADLLVFGGRNASALFQGGERWNKASGTWTNMTTVNQPSLRYAASGVWTGKEMIVWGGFCALNACMVNTGGRYNPQTNTWVPTATVANALQAREQTTVVWTGTQAVVWGGSYSDGVVQYLNSGGRYNPATATWTPTNLVGAPTGRQAHSAVWTGAEMVVMVGSDAATLNTSGKYTPATDSWVTIPAGGGGPTAGPTARYYASAVWDPGTARVLLWGGQTGPTTFTDTGKLYDPVGNAWSAMAASTGIVAARGEAATVWTGNEMLVWGGFSGTYLNTGGYYTPGTDTWTAVAATTMPGRKNHAAVWTGTDLIVWGGFDGTNPLSDGGVYNRASNTWTYPMATSPLSGRRYHTAVWTGSEMLVWGGYGVSTSNGLADGAAYAYPGNSWRMMSSNRNTAFGRGFHAAWWTGSEMYVFGGGHGAHLFSGGRYDP